MSGHFQAIRPRALPVAPRRRGRRAGGLRRAFAIVCSGALAWHAAGNLAARQVPVPFRSDYLVEHWGLQDGFPENSCSGAVQAPDGAMWFGTFRGLVRFNGREFRSWGPPALPALARTGIIAMFRDSRSRVWLSTDDGLVSNEGVTWRRWREADGWNEPRDFVRSWGEAPDGRMAFGRFGGRVMVLEAGRWRELPPLPGRGGAWCAFDGSGVLYGARVGFVGVLDGDRWRPLPGGEGAGAQTLGLGQRRDGAVCLVTPDEILDVRGGGVTGRRRLSDPVAAFWRLSEDREGRLWLATLADGLFRIQTDGTVRHFGRADGLPLAGGARVAYPDEHDAMWIGGGVGALIRLRPPRFRLLGETEGFGDRVSLTVAPLPGGRVLLSSYGAGPMEFDGVGTAHPLAAVDLQVRSLLRAADGTVWFGTAEGGLWQRTGGALRPEPGAGFAPDETISTLFEDSRRRLWIGGDRHVVVRDGARFQAVPLPKAGERNRSTFFAEGRDGAIILARRHEVFHWRLPAREPEVLCRLPGDERISTIAVDAGGRLWIGTSAHGLYVWHEGKLARLGVEQGLPSATIASLIEDNEGKLWFGCGRNLVRLDPAAAWRTARDATGGLEFQRFDQHDGLRNLEFPSSFQPSAARDDQGRLWFALTRGAGFVDPAGLRLETRPPPVAIESLSFVPPGTTQAVEQTVTTRGPEPMLPAGSRLIRIGYTALDLQAPGKHRFRVRLGQTGQWQEMRNEASVSFLELPPGRHELRVQASGSDGVWNRTGATLRFTIAPYFWQTFWFRAGVLGLGAGLIGGGAWLAAQRRVRAERERYARDRRLAEAQARLALVLENTNDLVLFTGPAGDVIFLNRAGRTLLGVAAEAAPAAATTALAALLERMKAVVGDCGQPEAWTGDSKVFDPSGREIAVSVAIGAHRGPTGELEFVSAIARDISAVKKQAEVQDALRELAAGLNAARDTDGLGRTIAASCRRLFAHDAFYLILIDEATGADENVYLEDTVEGDAEPKPRPTETRDLSPTVRRVLEGETVLLNRTGLPGDPSLGLVAPGGVRDRRAASLMYVPVWWAGRPIGLLSVQSYVAQRYGPADVQLMQSVAMHCGAAIRRIHAEEELRVNEARLRQAQKLEAVGTLAGGIAHDFNNILTAILGNVDLVRLTQAVAPEGERFLEQIRLSGLRARDLVRRILTFSRPREGVRRPVALPPLIEEVRHLLRATLPATIELEAEVPENLPLVPADATEIHQVLVNLATNAGQALGRRPGRILFRLAPCEVVAGAGLPHPDLLPGPHVRVTVQDNGPGIPPDVLPRIFDPFFTTKAPGEGSGLGLSVAHGIVHAYGGAITVDGGWGRGAAFHIYLPALAGAEVAVAKAEPTAVAPPVEDPGRGEHILAVDDEETLIVVLVRFLEAAGYTCTGCTDPLAALRLFEAEPDRYAAVITDFSMPRMTGVELTRRMRAIRPELAVVLTSGYLRKEDRAAALAAGVAACLEKPGDYRRIVPTLQGLLARK